MAPTQAALYRDLSDDLHLSWSEQELPERERTKHVHRLHPYLGKFVPQLVEALLGRYVRPGGRVLDPFAGSGTTLVQCLDELWDELPEVRMETVDVLRPLALGQLLLGPREIEVQAGVQSLLRRRHRG